MTAPIAVLNAGSSSIKFAIYDASGDAVRFQGQVQSIGLKPSLTVRDHDGAAVLERTWPAEGFDAGIATLEIMRAGMEVLQGERIQAIGHRVAHGGTEYGAPVFVDDTVVAGLTRAVKLAPLHQPHNLAPIRAIMVLRPDLPQVACFDSGFHCGQAAVVRRFGLPRRLHDEGVRRYGFHGLSYEFVAGRLGELAPEIAAGRVVICHLGSGSSLCAVQDGRSVATTMGFTGLEGLLMGTRCGAIDPGVLLYLMDTHGMDARAIEDLSRIASRVCLACPAFRRTCALCAPRRRREAAEAIALYVYRIVREIGSLAAALGGLDGVVFTGGIGENDAATRAEVAQGCAWLGLTLDEARNTALAENAGWRPDQRGGLPRRRLGGADRRGTHDRPPHR